MANTTVYNDNYYRNLDKYPALKEALSNPQDSLLIYPSERAKAVRLKENPDSEKRFRFVILLDGTWQTCKRMYHKNKDLLERLPTHWRFEIGRGIYDKMRKEPTNGMSTLEAVALALSVLENDENIYYRLLKPLEHAIDQWCTERLRKKEY
jgi:DTW domain-containing protein YfiP